MSKYALKNDEQYYQVNNYSVKCRLYPNKEQSISIDNIIHGIQAFHNMVLHDMFINHRNTKKVIDKETGETIHFPDLKSVVKADYITELREQNWFISCVPASALSGNNGIVLNDIKRMLETQSANRKIKPIESLKPLYYSKKKQRESYTYQESMSKILRKENDNVLYISLAKVGQVKVRGFNKRIRFGSQLNSFFVYCQNNKKYQMTVTISKDNCKQYWIIFRFCYDNKKDTGVLVNVPAKIKAVKEVGVDVGIKDISILSDGSKYENKRFAKNQKKKMRALSRRLARQNGFANEKFREEYKVFGDLRPSKRYLQTNMKIAKLHKDISNKRKEYNNVVSKDIVNNNSFIGIESLNVKGMIRNRYLAYALSDVAIGDLLEKLKYKSEWYGREIKAIDKWTPSTQLCSNCGYKYKGIKLSVREWTCPVCGEHHDRDINAATNILHFAKEM